MNGLDALLNPAAVAIVGASDDPRRIGGRPIAHSLAAGFTGRLYPVNPNRSTVQGLTAYASLADIPEAIDLAIVAVPAAEVARSLEQAAAKGARAAIVFSAGFSEVGHEGAALQRRLLDIAAAANMRLLGPNCVGLFNARIGHIATFSSGPEAGLSPNGRVGLMSQSGAYGTHLLAQARNRRIEVGQWVSTGNEADVGAGDVIEAFAADPSIAVIAAYLEGVKNGPGLLRALAAARDARKPVVLLKVGRSAAGAAAAAAHTASLTGEDAVFDAAIAACGAIRVNDTGEMFDLVYGASHAVLPKGPGLGIITISGGAGVMMADAAEAGGLTLPQMPEAAQAKLLKRNAFASPANPVDVTAQAMNDFPMVKTFLEALLAVEGYDSFVGFFTSWGGSAQLGPKLRTAIVDGTHGLAGRPLALVILAGDDVIADYEAAGFLVFDDPTRAVQTLARMAAIAAGFDRPGSAGSIDLGEIPPFPTEAISETAGKTILSAIGVAVLPETVVRNAGDAAAAADRFSAPVAMKLVSPDVAHKTEIGGVRLGIDGGAAAGEAYDAIVAAAARLAPDARIEGVLVTPMAGSGVELIVGVRHDATFGAVTMVGMGGIFVEVMKDVALRVGPVSADDALAMIRSLAGYPLLAGTRGRRSGDLAAAADAVARLSSYAARHADRLDSIEINPLLVRETGAYALDALFSTRSGAGACGSG